MRECLLLQLDYLEHNGATVPPGRAARSSRSHLEDLGAHKYGYIAGELGITTDEVEEARDFIRSQLSPFPLQSQEARSWKSPNTAPYVAPDVVISLHEDEFVVEVVEARHFFLRMSPLYETLAATLARPERRASRASATPTRSTSANLPRARRSSSPISSSGARRCERSRSAWSSCRRTSCAAACANCAR